MIAGSDDRNGFGARRPLWITGLAPPDSSPVAAPSQLPTAESNTPAPSLGQQPHARTVGFSLAIDTVRRTHGTRIGVNRLRGVPGPR